LVILNVERQRIAVESQRVCEVRIERREILPQHLLVVGIVEIDAENLRVGRPDSRLLAAQLGDVDVGE